jgi:hypothetical protein
MKQIIDKVTGKPLSRGEAEAKIKDKAGWVITVFAALLAINTLFSSGNSSKILNNTIMANDTWGFYQAKSIKQTLAEMNLETAIGKGETVRVGLLREKISKFESDPTTGEGKRELMIKAKKLEAERADAKQRSPWYTYAGSLLQIAIVLMTASILAVSMSLFWGSLTVGVLGSIIMTNGIWMWMSVFGL